MEISYKREIKHNYLIIDPSDLLADEYEIGMLLSNNISGLLKFHIKNLDDERTYYYDITSKQPLTRLLEARSLCANDLKNFISGLIGIVEGLESYLLSEEQVLLEPEYIYVEVESFTPFLCLVPGRRENFMEDLTKMLQYLLGKINHADKECVVLGYGLYQISLKDNYCLMELLELTMRGGIDCQFINIDQNSDDDMLSHLEEDGEDTNDRKYKFINKHVVTSASNNVNIGYNTRGYWGNLCVVLAVFAGGPLLFWILGGLVFIKDYWWLLVSADGAAVGLAGIRFTLEAKRTPAELYSYGDGSDKDKNSGHKKQLRSENEIEPDWTMLFEEDGEPNIQQASALVEAKEEECQTVLLTSAPVAQCRCLRSMSPDIEDIHISYVPYLIGKQTGLADGVIFKDVISRLHVKIDCADGIYSITDLNSTNGTSVKGVALEANETVTLKDGDEVYLANVGFVFT